jgi:glyoxylase-like metal-dependent hydrolase (beta-lactamase superfamily II)
MVSIAEMADRPPRPLTDGEVLELGSKRVRHIDTPHGPHAWEAPVLYEETTATLLCGDLFTHLGDGPPLTDGDIVGAASEAEDLFAYSCLAPTTPAIVERLAERAPRTLALMHGSSFNGDCPEAPRALAADYRHRISRAS